MIAWVLRQLLPRLSDETLAELLEDIVDEEDARMLRRWDAADRRAGPAGAPR